jgi:hypothetical protein
MNRRGKKAEREKAVNRSGSEYGQKASRVLKKRDALILLLLFYSETPSTSMLAWGSRRMKMGCSAL